MKEAILYEKLDNNIVKCNICNHFCCIGESQRGFCGVRQNEKGKLFSLVYGKIIAANVDPIEKKPLFHFLPGSKAFSIATTGCNFRCQQCQNWQISQATKLFPKDIPGEKITSKEIIKQAVIHKCQSIAYTYTEPTIFLEFALDIMKLAKEKGLKNIWVSNGYMSKDTLNLISPYLNAINIDLKFFKDELYKKICDAKLKPILNNIKEMKKRKIWLEITTLLIPDLIEEDNQLEKIAKFIKEEIGDQTPWHISKFHPQYEMTNKNITSDELLNKAYEIGRKAGLKYIYVGNVSDDKRESTYCLKCGTLNIERNNYQVERFDKNGKCRKCNRDLALILK